MQSIEMNHSTTHQESASATASSGSSYQQHTCRSVGGERRVYRRSAAPQLSYWLFAAAAVAAIVALTAPTPAAASPGPRAGSSPALLVHHLTKRSFFDIQCKGVYDKSIFARLDRICEDCYNLFREPQIHSLCRNKCFTTDYFKGCLDTLQLSSEMEQVQIWIKQLHGAEPGV